MARKLIWSIQAATQWQDILDYWRFRHVPPERVSRYIPFDLSHFGSTMRFVKMP